MKKKKIYTHQFLLLLVLACFISCNGQNKTELPKAGIEPSNKEGAGLQGPQTITRKIIQDRKGHIWIAAYDGVFRYDGRSFVNISGEELRSVRFFSVLEDSKGNFWFSSVGSGVFYYDGKSFLNFTTGDGLANNQVADIYEDKSGNIWFGTVDGMSRYDGRTFRNFTTQDGLPNNDVGPIIEDKTGKIWIGTRTDASIFDGKTFTVLTHEGKPFKNVRSIIEDTKGNIWLGGPDGLWRYDGTTFTNFAQQYVGYVYEDQLGNIWTSANSDKTKRSKIDIQSNGHQKGWTLYRYHGESLENMGTLPTVITTNEGMIFGILEAADGSIWYGTLDGVYRYDGETITDF